MMQITMPLPLFRARLLLEEGRSEEALTILETTLPEGEDVQNNLAYLRGWCYIQNRMWDKAVQALSPLEKAVWKQDDDEETLAERERLITYFLRLGLVAVNLAHYDEALNHFNLCLKLLQDRRVHLPGIRIDAHISMAMVYRMKKAYYKSIEHYEEAVYLCKQQQKMHKLPDIYYGMCDVYQELGDFAEARFVGEEALRLYQEQRNERLESRIHNLLAAVLVRSGELEQANEHYMESQRLAVRNNQTVMEMLNYESMAELRLQQQHFVEATMYADRALDYARKSQDKHMAGRVYLTLAKVKMEIIEKAEVDYAVAYNEAVELFREAEESLSYTQAYDDLLTLYESWGTVLEKWGRTREAIHCWRRAYDMQQRLGEVKPRLY